MKNNKEAKIGILVIATVLAVAGYVTATWGVIYLIGATLIVIISIIYFLSVQCWPNQVPS